MTIDNYETVKTYNAYDTLATVYQKICLYVESLFQLPLF